jgi:hypothetical protein
MDQTIKAGKRELVIHHFTGKVAETTKHMETQVSGGGGGGMSYQGTGGSAPVTIRSTTIVHDQMFLVAQDGTERALQLQDFNLACRNGNIVTASWAVQVGSDEGAYFAVTNHSTGQQFLNDSVIRKLVTFGTKKSGAVLGCLVLAAIFIVGGWLCYQYPILLIPAIGWVAYMHWVAIPNYIKTFKQNVAYPKVELW